MVLPFDVEKNIPWEWQEVICQCVDPIYYHFLDFQNNPNIEDLCRACHKVPRFKFSICIDCKALYDTRYVHHERDKFFDRCWNCLLKLSPAIDGIDSPPAYAVAPRKARSLSEIMGDLDDLFEIPEVTF